MADEAFVRESEKDDVDLLKSYWKDGRIAGDFSPVKVYDLVQVGYPHPNRGMMVNRLWGGSDAEGKMLPPTEAPWCRVADVAALLEANGIDFYSLKPLD